MKTQKIILLVLMLAMALALVSCGSDDAAGPGWFDFTKEPSATDVSELKGELVDSNSEYDLVALRTSLVDNAGNIIEYINVYDLADGNKNKLTATCSISYDSNTVDFDVDLSNYPIIKTTRTYQITSNEGGYEHYEYDYSYDYYLIEKGENEARYLTYSNEDTLEVEEIGNVYLVELEDTLYWINRNLRVIREVPLSVSESYRGSNYETYFRFEAEYCDYLYTWEFDPANFSQIVVVYDPNGVASAKYDFSSGVAYVQDSSDGLINPSVFVLNDGNVLIQECIMVEGDGAFDFVYNLGAEPYKLDLVTKIMNYKTGEITDVECDMLITELESAYTALECNKTVFPFTLAKGDNQAYVISIKDGVVGRRTEYVILDNTLKTVYTLNNDYVAESSSYESIKNVSKSGYEASAYVNGALVECTFDWNGNIVFKHPTNYIGSVGGDYYVTASGVYTNSGKLVFNVDDSEFASADDDYFYIVGDNVYLYRYDQAEDAAEYYRLNLKEGKAELLADESDYTMVSPFTLDGACLVYNERKETVTFYNRLGEVVLVVSMNDDLDMEMLDHTVIIEVEVGDEEKIYVMELGDCAHTGN